MLPLTYQGYAYSQVYACIGKLSYSQSRLWAENELEGSSQANFINCCFDLRLMERGYSFLRARRITLTAETPLNKKGALCGGFTVYINV